MWNSIYAVKHSTSFVSEVKTLKNMIGMSADPLIQEVALLL